MSFKFRWPTVAVDFDGVIHGYSKGWQKGVIYDDPVEGVHEAMDQLRSAGYTLVIFTARTEHLPVKEWLVEHKLAHFFAGITNEKIPAVAYIDDRAAEFNGSWDHVIAQVDALDTKNHRGAAKATSGQLTIGETTVADVLNARRADLECEQEATADNCFQQATIDGAIGEIDRLLDLLPAEVLAQLATSDPAFA